jgi:hypothetical protein
MGTPIRCCAARKSAIARSLTESGRGGGGVGFDVDDDEGSRGVKKFLMLLWNAGGACALDEEDAKGWRRCALSQEG